MKSKRRRKARRNPLPLKGHPVKAALAMYFIGGILLGAIVPPESPFSGAVAVGHLVLTGAAYVACK